VLAEEECRYEGQGALYKWLTFNRITLDQVHCILAERPKATSTFRKDKAKSMPPLLELVSPDEAWGYVAQALAHAFPSQREMIESVEKHTITCFVSRPHMEQQALTIDEGKPNYPTVVCSYSGRPEELITMAHEFAHALQIMSSKEEGMPPVLREICAFIGELALLEYSKEKNICQYSALKKAWNLQNRDYLGRNLTHLKTALSQEAGEYNYTWNYPVARIIAVQLYPDKGIHTLWSLFEEGVRSYLYSDYLRLVGKTSSEISMIPAIPEVNGKLFLDRYSAMGVITILDIIYSAEISKDKIETYALEIGGSLANACLYIGFNKLKHPIGYCKYAIETSEAGATCVKSLREIAPFGQHSRLQAAFKRRFQSIGKVEVLHEA
jgi:hypothetical protein